MTSDSQAHRIGMPSQRATQSSFRREVGSLEKRSAVIRSVRRPAGNVGTGEGGTCEALGKVRTWDIFDRSRATSPRSRSRLGAVGQLPRPKGRLTRGAKGLEYGHC